MRIAVIAPEYPNENKSGYSFVHNRNKHYIAAGHNVKVFIISRESKSYVFENITVVKQPKKILKQSIHEFKPEVLAVHFPKYYIVNFINKLPVPKVVWLHGHDILWKFRLSRAKNWAHYLKKWLVLIPREAYQIYLLRKYLPRYKYCIFVSRGFLHKAERQTLRKYRNAKIIPNSVDLDKFSYKKPQNYTQGISLRPFTSKIYGLDIAIKAFQKSTDVLLDLYGQGPYKDKYINLIKKHQSKCRLFSKHIPHKNLPDLFHQYGFFVAPSRMDTQGVAMCEAMACGLPVVATRVGGIPEFVIDGYNGYLVPPNDSNALKMAVNKLLSDPDKYEQMSLNARKHMEKICAVNVTINREIDLLQNAIKSE